VFKFLNQEIDVGLIFCNFAKAFGHLNNNIFPAELHFYGARVTGCKSVEMLQAENKKLK
jgi:hypothetical protein